MVRTIERRRVVRDDADRVEEPVVQREERDTVVEDTTPAYTEPAYGDVVPGWAIVARRVVYYVLGIVEILLAFRFLLKLFAANASSPFVAFIYGITGPLVFPFEGVFRGFATGGAAFEPGTLLAIAVYAVLAWIIDRLITIIASAERNV